MTKRQTRKYEMLVRVQTFGVAHQKAFAEGSEVAKAFATVTDIVTQITAFEMAKLTAKRESMKARVAAKVALAARIGSIARSARVIAKAIPGADAKFPLPTRRTDVAVLTSGRLFLQEATLMKDTFISCGLAPTFVEDLQQSIEMLQQEIAGRSAGKTGAAVSQKGIREALKKGLDTVLSLDVLVRNVLGSDANAITAWKRGRHIEFSGRTAAASAPADTGGPEPSSPDEQPIAPVQPPSSQPTASQPAESSPVEEPTLPQRAA
jgi:hypothetical protein